MSKTAWQDVRLPRFPPLRKTSSFDVVVIGGGITGLSAAFFLKDAGLRVCLLERGRLGHGDTGCTTAHLTYVTDVRLSRLVKAFDRRQASLAWQAGETALDAIEAIVKSRDIDCQFQRVPAFLHAALHGENDEHKELRSEARLAQELGFHANFTEAAPLVNKPAIRFANQAKFHPLAYLAGLVKCVQGDGCTIAEETEVTAIEADPLVVKCGKLEIACGYVGIATHVPLAGVTGSLSAAFLQTKLASYSTYAIGAKIPSGLADEMSLWDTGDPYYYLRVDRHPKFDYVILGGADHKTGQSDDTTQPVEDLVGTLKELLPEAQVDRHWSGQVVETNDGLPLIGETADRQFVATGFGGNGMTFGTLAGMMARDAVLKRENPWQALFAATRTKVLGGAGRYFKENIDFPYYYLADRMTAADATSTREIQRGEGRIIKMDGQRVACSKDDEGKLSTVSAICTHMGCLVRWNATEQTWDCPCHGSRFQADGKVLAGPAETPLEPIKHTENGRKPAAKSKSSRRGRSSAAGK